MSTIPPDYDDFDFDPTIPDFGHFFDDALTAGDLVRILVEDSDAVALVDRDNAAFDAIFETLHADFARLRMLCQASACAS